MRSPSGPVRLGELPKAIELLISSQYFSSTVVLVLRAHCIQGTLRENHGTLQMIYSVHIVNICSKLSVKPQIRCALRAKTTVLRYTARAYRVLVHQCSAYDSDAVAGTDSWLRLVSTRALAVGGAGAVGGPERGR